MEIALMIEGQNGLNWKKWKRVVALCEDLGFAGLYRSDHFSNANAPDRDSLELWVSLTWLAANTKRIEFGPLVSPLSFRHPAMTARMAAAVDDLSEGRLELGLGAGWQVREHNQFGFDLLEIGPRFERFEEGLQIITHLLREKEALTFEGKYFKLNRARTLPHPQRPAGPPIVIGGNGPKRTLPLVARYADEWNALYIPAGKFTELNQQLEQLLQAEGRDPKSLRRSMMTGLILGKDNEDLNKKMGKLDLEEIRQKGMLVGTPEEIKKQISELEKAGLQRVMLQWLDLNDLKGIELLAKTLIA